MPFKGTKTHNSSHYDVIVVGGGAIGLSAALNAAKRDAKVLVIERFFLFNVSGSSGDFVRMFRTMYSDEELCKLALKSKEMWHELEKESGKTLIEMSGLLNFGNPDYKDGPEGNLTDPIPILKKLGVPFTLYENGADIEKDYPCFKNLPANYKAVYSPWNGTINVTLALRTLYELGVNTKNADYIEEEKVVKIQPQGHSRVLVVTEHVGDAGHVTENHYSAGKVIVASGAYVNHVTRSLGFEINLQIWEMVFMYFSMKPSFNYPCMWFQFENPDDENQSRLFYGFPAIPGSPPNCARIAVDWAARIIADPVYRRMDVSELEPDMTHRFVAKHCNDVLSQPQFQGTCLMPNVPDNGFVLDFSPESFVGEHHKNIIIFTAGWAFKFIPLFGHILADLALDGSTSYNIRSMCIDRQNVLKPVAAVPDVGSHLPMKGPYFE